MVVLLQQCRGVQNGMGNAQEMSGLNTFFDKFLRFESKTFKEVPKDIQKRFAAFAIHNHVIIHQSFQNRRLQSLKWFATYAKKFVKIQLVLPLEQFAIDFISCGRIFFEFIGSP